MTMNKGRRRTVEQRKRLVSLDEAAERLGLNANTLRERSYRERIGLEWVKIGQRVKFVEADLAKFIDDRRQGGGAKLPQEPTVRKSQRTQ